MLRRATASLVPRLLAEGSQSAAPLAAASQTLAWVQRREQGGKGAGAAWVCHRLVSRRCPRLLLAAYSTASTELATAGMPPTVYAMKNPTPAIRWGSSGGGGELRRWRQSGCWENWAAPILLPIPPQL